MSKTAERQQMIGRIDELPAQLESVVKGLSDEQLDTPYRDGGWTVRQVVHHLADSHLNAFARIKLILTEEHPTLKPYDQDAWSKLPDTRMPVSVSLAILRGLHARWVAVLNNISEAEWTRAAFHPEQGEMTVETLLSMYARHGENHVGQVRSLRDARGW